VANQKHLFERKHREKHIASTIEIFLPTSIIVMPESQCLLFPVAGTLTKAVIAVDQIHKGKKAEITITEITESHEEKHTFVINTRQADFMLGIRVESGTFCSLVLRADNIAIPFYASFIFEQIPSSLRRIKRKV